MNLEQLRKTHVEAVQQWLDDEMGGHGYLPAAHATWDSCSVQIHKDDLFLVWNNGCYLQPFSWNGRWRDLDAEFRMLRDVLGGSASDIPWYAAAVEELAARMLD